MEKNEIKKVLYKEKPVAIKQVNDGGDPWYYSCNTSIGDVFFAVPTSDMGERLFGDKVEAQLLIRWMI